MAPSDDMLAALIYNPIDVCYTDLLHTFPWEASYKTVKWGEVVRLKMFDDHRELASRIFDIMERHGTQCPTVTKVDGRIWITWSADTRIFRVVLCSGEPNVYYRGHTSDLFELDPIAIESEETFLASLPVIAHFISPPKVYDGSRDQD